MKRTVTAAACVAAILCPAKTMAAGPRIPAGEVASVEVSSLLNPAEGKWVGRFLLDGVAWSLWTSEKAHGAGEWVRMGFSRPRCVSRVGILPGNGRNDKAFQANMRVARLRIEDEAGCFTVDVPDQRRLVDIALPRPAIGKAVNMVVEAVEGPGESSLVVSDIVLFEPEDPAGAAAALVRGADRRLAAAAARYLAASGPGGLAALEELLLDGRGIDEEEVARAIGSVAGEQATRSLVRLAGRRPRLDAVLGGLLAGRGAEAVVALLDRLEEEPYLEPELAAIMARSGVDRMALAASRSARSSMPEMRVMAALLGATGSPAAAAGLDAIFERGDSSVRSIVMEALALLPAGEARGRILRGLDDPDVKVRGAAAFAAGSLGLSEAEAILIARLGERASDRTPWIDALGLMRSRAAVPVMARLFHSATPAEQRAIVRACDRVGNRDAYTLLVQIAADFDPDLASAASDALRAVE